MSKQLVYWVTRGHRLDVPDDGDLTVDEYIQLIKNNGCLENSETPMTLEEIEAKSTCVHFEGQIVEVNSP